MLTYLITSPALPETVTEQEIPCHTACPRPDRVGGERGTTASVVLARPPGIDQLLARVHGVVLEPR